MVGNWLIFYEQAVNPAPSRICSLLIPLCNIVRMEGYRQYVSFDRNADTNALAKEWGMKLTHLNAEERSKVERAFSEIAATPEGRFLLERAAAKSPDGKINVVATKDGQSMSGYPNDIILGRGDSNF